VKYDIEECLARLNSLRGELNLIRRVDKATNVTTLHPSKYDYSSSKQHHSFNGNTTYVINQPDCYFH